QIRAGTRLYKWTHRPLFGEHGISPWWFFVESRRLPSGTAADGLRVSEQRARRLQKPHREFARVGGAVSEEFGNRMEQMLLIQLTQPVYGFAGTVSAQPEFAKERRDLQNVFLIGGACQVWIPGLQKTHLQQIPVEA